MENFKRLFVILGCVFVFALGTSVAQDPTYTQFFLNESRFNPALVGYRGALSFMAKYKTQWNTTGVSGFQSGYFSMEESLPCSVFDYGISMNGDQEGDGLLKTLETALRVAGTVAWDAGFSSHNARIGLGLGWASKRIDYDRLLFSDELDPKYGTVNSQGVDLSTAFIPPNDGRSLWFFSPSIGFSHRILLNRQNRKSPTLHYGIAVHHAFSLGDREYTGNIESILSADTRIAPRINVFANGEFILISNGRSFFSTQPVFVWQQQSQLSYFEIGNRFHLNRNLSMGVHYHGNVSKLDRNMDTNWLTIEGQFGGMTGAGRRIDLGVSYAANLTGLRNYLGPILEVSLGIHLAKSPTCKLAGFGDEVPYGNDIKCPTSALTPGRRKLYEGIWYKTIK